MLILGPPAYHPGSPPPDVTVPAVTPHLSKGLFPPGGPSGVLLREEAQAGSSGGPGTDSGAELSAVRPGLAGQELL